MSDLHSVEEIHTLEPGGIALGISFSPDEALIAAGGGDTITLWDADSGREINKFVAHATWIYSVPFSPDGTRIASCGDDKVIRLWDARSGKKIATFTGHSQRVMSVAFSPDGSRLASASHDTTVKLWDVRSCQQATTLRGHTREISSITFSPYGSRIASGSNDRSIKLWDANSGTEIQTFTGHGHVITCVAFSPDGQQLAVACDDRTIHLWPAKPDHEVTTLTGHTNTVRRVTFSLDGKRIYSDAANEKFVWDAASGNRLENIDWDPPSEQKQVSPDGRWFVTRELNHVLLVDGEYRNTPDEKAYRAAKARFDPTWHQEQATAAITAKNWFAATFHVGFRKTNPTGQAALLALPPYSE